MTPEEHGIDGVRGPNRDGTVSAVCLCGESWRGLDAGDARAGLADHLKVCPHCWRPLDVMGECDEHGPTDAELERRAEEARTEFWESEAGQRLEAGLA